MEYKYLFTPIKVGSTTIKNRIVTAPHATHLFSDGNIMDERYVEYHRARARGGAGLIIAGGMTVMPSSRNIFVQEIYDEKVVPLLRQLAEAVHEHGAKIFVQIVHCGRQMASGFGRQPIWAPSAIPCPVIREMPKAMEVNDIQAAVKAFATAAWHAQEDGLDGVEIHGTNGYLINEFMSPYSNHRTDHYGGSLENRLRFPMEVIDAIREAVGEDFVVGIRLPGDELLPGGLTVEDMKEIARQLEGSGKIDYIHLGHFPYASIYAIGTGMQVPLGFNSGFAAQFKEAVDLPIINTFRINDPHQAEKILADGQGDMVGMVRALIADPELPNKAREGRLDEIRSCIACNQGCGGRIAVGLSLSCLQNPVAGLEKEIGAIEPARSKKKVLVVGGGPGGMEAARVARLRGHEVVLYEKEKELGGQVNIAVKAPERSEFGGITRYLARQMEILGVKVHLGSEVTGKTVEQEKPDTVVIATGSRPAKPTLPGVDQENVVTVWDVLQEKAAIGNNVVVMDSGDAHWQCCSTVEYLSEKGKKVELITPMLFVGMGLATSPDLFAYYMRVRSKGVVFSPNTLLLKISGSTLAVMDIHSKIERNIEGVDTVVLATGNRADNELYMSLKDRVKELYAVGDCIAPRKAMDAIYEGYNVGRGI